MRARTLATRTATDTARRTALSAVARLTALARRLESHGVRWFAWIGLGLWALFALRDIGYTILEHRPGAWLAIATAAVVLLAALASSVAGFAFSALAGSALAYLKVDPLHAVQTMVVCSTASQLYAVWKIRDSIRWRTLWPMLAAGVLTVPLGVSLLKHMNASFYAVGLGAFMTLYGCYVVMRQEHRVVPGNPWVDAAAGALGGITGGLAGFPGSFVTIWCSMRGWDKLEQRAAYQPYILAMQIVTIVCLWCQSSAHASVLQNLSFVPFALLGAMGGFAVFQRMSNKRFHQAVSILLIVSGAGLLARAL